MPQPQALTPAQPRHRRRPLFFAGAAAVHGDEEEDLSDADPYDNVRHADDDNDDDVDDDDDDDSIDGGCCAMLSELRKPVEVGEMGIHLESAFWAWPLFGPLLFMNTSSDVRDGLANERTFLSYLRLSVTMTVLAVAIVLSFHLKHQPTALELRMALPLGIIFWCLALLTLVVGVANYIKTVNKYSRRAAIVQTGWKTQSIMGTVAACILGSCVALLVINRLTEDD